MITGVIGSCVDGMLCPIEMRKCRIIGASFLGKKLENGTYTGKTNLWINYYKRFFK